MEYEFEPWEIYNGGGCPVDPGTLGQIQRRGDSAKEAERGSVCDLAARHWDLPRNIGGAIHAFRRVKKAQTVTLYGYHSASGRWVFTEFREPCDTQIITFNVDAKGNICNISAERI